MSLTLTNQLMEGPNLLIQNNKMTKCLNLEIGRSKSRICKIIEGSKLQFNLYITFYNTLDW